MKKALLFMACLMILLCVSCRSEALELVNVYLDSPVSKTTWAATTTLSTENLFYRATALSEGRTYGSSENYLRYNSGDPLTLTQGLWLIEVISFNDSSTVPSTVNTVYERIVGDTHKLCYYAEGSTTPTDLSSTSYILGASDNPVYVNLNTSSISVYPLGSGDSTGTTPGTVFIDNYTSDLATAYKDYKDQTMTVSFFKMTADGKLISYNSSTTPTDASAGYIGSFSTTKVDGVSVTASGSASFAPGRYVCCFNIFEASDKDHPIFIDTVSFYVKSGKSTGIGGRCSVQTAIEEVKWEPGIAGAGNNYDIGSDSTADRTYSGIADVSVQNNTTYILYPDDESSSGSNTHTIGSSNGSKLNINPNEVTQFAVDLNGTNAKIEATDSNQVTTFVKLEDGVTMDLVNNGDSTAVIGSVVNSSGEAGTISEHYATIELAGGTLNVVDPTSPVVISGPTQGSGFSGREGAINFSQEGGTINLSGNVSVGPTSANTGTTNEEKIVKGITSFTYPDTNKKTQTSTLVDKTSPTDLEINLTNGAEINVYGDSNESPAGIYLLGQTTYGNQDKVAINLSDAKINVVTQEHVDTGSVSVSEGAAGYGIFMKDFGAATIDITITDSMISDNNGNPIYIENCDGPITLTIKNSIILSSGASCGGVYFKNCDGVIKIVIENTYMMSQRSYCYRAQIPFLRMWLDNANYNVKLEGCNNSSNSISVSFDDSKARAELKCDGSYSSYTGKNYYLEVRDNNIVLTNSTLNGSSEANTTMKATTIYQSSSGVNSFSTVSDYSYVFAKPEEKKAVYIDSTYGTFYWYYWDSKDQTAYLNDADYSWIKNYTYYT